MTTLVVAKYTATAGQEDNPISDGDNHDPNEDSSAGHDENTEDSHDQENEEEKDPRRHLNDLLHEHRQLHSASDLGRDHSFSWLYCVISLGSYVLLLSDVLRAGLGMEKVLDAHHVDPDVYVNFGPYAYLVKHLPLADAMAGTPTAFWGYKYDTTSIAMRSVAEILELPAWSPCLLYKEKCDETLGLPLSSVFSMLDEMVDAVGAHHATQAARRLRGQLLVRSESRYRDRIHHYALPWLFEATVKRTNQVTHHTYNATGYNAPVCGNSAPLSSSHRPHSCDENWTHYGRLNCPATGLSNCSATARLWDNIPRRLAFLAQKYPNHTIDYVILDSMQDFSRSQLSFQRRKYFDVVVFTRIRACDDGFPSPVCTTVAVDDFRFEGTAFAMTAPTWFSSVATLRIVGQAYTWLRVGMLVRGCYLARTREERFRQSSVFAKVRVTARAVFLIPSQVVIYGSSFPIILYMIAHLIDSAAVYEIIAAHFDTTLGIVSFNVADFVHQCAVSMRTVWILGFLSHAALSLTTSRSWSPIDGVPGMTELTLTLLASLTIFSQFRSLSFRDARILHANEVMPSLQHRHFHSASYDSTRTIIDNMFFSSTIDTKVLICGAIILFGITLVFGLLHRAAPTWFAARVALASRTAVPYSAGVLWPRSSLVVSWFGALLSEALPPQKKPPRSDAVTPRASLAKMMMQAAWTAKAKAPRVPRGLKDTPDKGLIMRHLEVSRNLQQNMHTVDRRSHEIDSMVYLVNLAAMSDPITFFNLRVFPGQLVGLYRAKLTQRCLLLPCDLVASDANLPIDWNQLELLAVVNSKDLEWPDLLRCG